MSLLSNAKIKVFVSLINVMLPRQLIEICFYQRLKKHINKSSVSVINCTLAKTTGYKF